MARLDFLEFFKHISLYNNPSDENQRSLSNGLPVNQLIF